jgi:hypothetical protein
MAHTRENLVATLKSNVCTVEFQKVNGTQRKMRCTLVESHIPAPTETEKPTKNGEPRKRSNEIISVWDLEKAAWRSFRIDSVQNITVA